VNSQNHTRAREVILQFIRFSLVGIVNTGLTYAVYAALLLIGVNHFVALGAAYAVGIVFSFVVNKRLTFRVTDRASLAMFLRMAGSYILLLALNALILWVLVDKNDVNPYLGQAMAVAVVALLSFAAQRILVFGVHRKETNG
jgi:putative flippase GtrA